MTDPVALMQRMFRAALDAADPLRRVPAFLPEPPSGRLLVVGAGKASARMAQAVEANWPGELNGLVVTRYGHGAPCARIEIVEAAHPVPDQAGLDAAERMLQMVSAVGPDDLCLALISGGGSALLSAPVAGIGLADKQAVNRALLASGAAIGEMNCVRKHLSRVKGGRLAAAAAPARMVSLLISDVPGDDPGVIASGPTVADPTTLEMARRILDRYGIVRSAAVDAALSDPANETLKPGDSRLDGNAVHLIAAPQQSLEAAAAVAKDAGVVPVILGDALEGEAREVGKVMAGIAAQVRRHGQPGPAPCALISGGETTVTVRGAGRGGRNVEFLLGLAEALIGAPGIYAIACDTDGIDGAEDVAGAIVRPETPTRAAAVHRSLADALAENDGHGFFEAIGDQVITGPTLTNVNDFRVILVLP